MTFIAFSFACGIFCFAGPSEGQDSQPATSPAASQPTQLQVGSAAPDFTVPLPESMGGKPGETISLHQFMGKKNVVLAFFPKADTPGCTTQMCGYRDDWSTFNDNDTTVISISADQQSAEDKFKQKYNLPMIILGDPEHKLIQKFGVPQKESGNAQRSVILLDKTGVVRYVNYNYNVQKDKEALMEKVKELKVKE